jgi:hypothetical protein
MVLTKLWLIVLSVACGAALVAALLAPEPLKAQVEQETGARLARAQNAASLLLKVNARQWMDSAAQMARDAVLVEALDQASRDKVDKGSDLTLVHKTVQERLHTFSNNTRIDIALATDVHGRVVARAVLDEGVYRDGVEGFPVVADALRGRLGDDTWSLAGKLYRVVAAPVIKSNEHYAGALVIGQEVGPGLAQSMRKMLDVDVAFLLRGRVLASSLELSSLPQLTRLYDAQKGDLEQTDHIGPLPVGGDEAEGGRGPSYLVVLAPFVGEASQHGAAYALLAPRPETAGLRALLALLVGATGARTLSWQQLIPPVAAALVAILVGLLLLQLEAGRPIKRLQREAQELARGDVQRLDDDRHPGRLGAAARAINTTLERLSAIGATNRVGHADRDVEPLYHRVEPRAEALVNPQTTAVKTQALRPGGSPPPVRAAVEPAPEPSEPDARMGARGGDLFGGLSDPGLGAQGRIEGAMLDVRPQPSPRPPTAADVEPTPTTGPEMKLSLADTEMHETQVAPPPRADADGPDLIDGPSLLPPLGTTGVGGPTGT